MRRALDEVATSTAPTAAPGGSRETFGAYLVPTVPATSDLPVRGAANPTDPQGKISGPSWIRTRDQSVMSRQL